MRENSNINKALAYYIGYSTDDLIRYKASSGGIGTSIIKYLLSTSEYDTSMTFVYDKEKCGYIPKLIYDFNEINICGSVYQDIDIFSFLKENISSIKNGIIVTCMPCQVQGIRSVLDRNNINNFIISFCCSGQTTLEGTWLCYRYMGIDKSQVINMQYRGNGWPSGIQIELFDGKKIYKNNYTNPWRLMHQSKLFRPKRCLMCKEDISYKADVSLADPWLGKYKISDKIGHTMFLINTEKGLAFIEEMKNKSLLRLIDSSVEDYIEAQGHTIMAKDKASLEKKFNNILSKMGNNILYKKIMTLSPFMLRFHMLIIRIVIKLLNKNIMKPYIIISGLNFRDNNRGTAALSYGSLSFLNERELLSKETKILNFRFVKNLFKSKNRGTNIHIAGVKWEYLTVNVFFVEALLVKYLHICLPFTNLGRMIKQVEYVAAINGGDGFSDIYNTTSFLNRLPDINLAMKFNIPVIILPQTLGPFRESKNKVIADRILCYASQIFVRDDKYASDLEAMGLKYEQTRDLSYYMKPEPFNIEIKANAIGINISGLAYSNKFRTLSGQFSTYPYLINKLIVYFQQKNIAIYLIPHSYNYQKVEVANDDLEAARDVYSKLHDKSNIILIDQDLISPQIKFIISQMKFFIGTRMHANFAAMYTGVPLFGLAYSYKFQGAFEANGIYDSTAMINDISEKEADAIVERIVTKYKSLD